MWASCTQSCRRGFRRNGISQGLEAGTDFVEGVGGSWLGRRVEDEAENVGEAQFLDHQVKEFIR